jgi:hypothetical protein
MLSTDWKGYRTIAWIMQGILGVALVAMLIQANWFAAASLAGFLLASFLFVKLERKLPCLFDLVFMIAALINAVGWAWNLYNRPGPVDEIAHFYTIFAITLATGFIFYQELMESFYDHRVMFVLTIAGLGIALGALWEVIEWLSDFVLPQEIVSGLFDTMTDLILDSAGAVLAALLNLWGLNELRSKSAAKQPQPAPAVAAPAKRRETVR